MSGTVDIALYKLLAAGFAGLPAQTGADNLAPGLVPVSGPMLWSGSVYNRQQALVAVGNALGLAGSGAGMNGILLFNGTSWDGQRTPSVFKNITATASGDTAVWTPTTGKKFRLMGFAINVTANAAQSVAGVLNVVLRDATTPIGLGYSVFVPGAAGANFQDDSSMGFIQLGNGYLSTTTNNVLNINLSAALTSGVVQIVAIGTEE